MHRSQGVSNPLTLQRIVEEELGKYQRIATQKNISNIMTTLQYGAGRADLMLSTLGVAVKGTLGPRPISQQLVNSLTINVKNEIGSLSASAQQKVSQALIEGVNNGDGPRVIAKSIVESTAMEQNRAVMIARTETNRANNEASVSQYQRYGVQQVRWLATPDERACDECGAHDGEIYDMGEQPEIPAHPNCRCVLLPEIPEIGQ